MKAFVASVRREFALIFRNGITIFMVAAPAILALVFILIFGAVNNSTLQLAIDSSVSVAERRNTLTQVDRRTAGKISAALSSRIHSLLMR